MSDRKKQTLREKIVDDIRAKIISHELETGDHIVEMELAAKYQSSRAPIREALRQLENEGLVEYVRNAGCSVKEITAEDSFEIYLMRSEYETLAVKLLAGDIPDATIHKMEGILNEMQCLQKEEFDRIYTLDNDFHAELILMTGLPRLFKAWKALNYGNIITGYRKDANLDNVIMRQYTHHAPILEACRTKDRDHICKVIRDHYMKSIYRLLEDQGRDSQEFPFSLDFISDNI